MQDDEARAVEAHEHGAWEGAAPIYVDYVANLTATSGQLDIIDDLIALDRSDRVLDVGCGPGVFSAQLADVVAQVTGVDFSAAMIAEAQRLHPRIEFHVANAEDLPFEDGSFDVAVVNYCAHHLARPEQAFAEIRRVLASGGRLAVVHPIQSRQPSWGSFADAVSEVLPPETVPGGALLNVAEPDVYVDLLSECGYREVECAAREKPVELASLGALLEAGWVIAGLHEQPQDVQDRIEAGVRQRAEPYRNPDDSYTFGDIVLAACGVA